MDSNEQSGTIMNLHPIEPSNPEFYAPDMTELDTPEDVFMQIAQDHLSFDALQHSAHWRWVFSQWLRTSNQGAIATNEEVALRITQVIYDSKTSDISMNAACLLFILNLSPVSEAEIAEKHGKTRAWVSDRVLQIKDQFNLTGVRGCKSEDARKVYAERATRVHKQRKEQIKQCKPKPRLNEAA